MTWRGTVRSMRAAARQAEREAKKRQRELERQQRDLEKMHELERAAREVQIHEQYERSLVSLHKEGSEPWDWDAIYSSSAPETPARSEVHQRAAESTLQKWNPNIFDKLLWRVETKREALVQAIEDAKQRDEAEYQSAIREHQEALADWERTRGLAARIRDGDLEAYEEAVGAVDPFGELEGLGSSVELRMRDRAISRDNVPRE